MVSLSLPAEVWLLVFDWAVFVPNAFDTHAPNPFAYPGPWTQDQIQKGIHASLTTKRRLTLVCKTWNALATPSLYSAIFIPRAGSLQSLLRTLHTEDATGMLKGRWAARLDIACPADNCPSSADTKELLQLLPCLRIIVLRPGMSRVRTPYSAEALFDALATRIDRSIYVLDVTCISIPIDISCIEKQPLRVLRIRTCYTLCMSLHEMSMSDIEHLDVPLPVLHAILESTPPHSSPSFITLSHKRTLHRMIENLSSTGFGDHVTSLELNGYRLTVSHVRETFRKAWGSCPILRNVIISLERVTELPAVSLPPSIERLGLHLHDRNGDSRKWCKMLGAALSETITKSSSIKVIRIIGEPTLSKLAKHHSGSLDVMQKLSARLLLENRVRFEDSTGQLFHEDCS